MLAETSRSYEGPLDPQDRFVMLLAHWSNEAAQNALRTAFRLGIEYAKETFDHSPFPPSHDEIIWKALLK